MIEMFAFLESFLPSLEPAAVLEKFTTSIMVIDLVISSLLELISFGQAAGRKVSLLPG